MKYVVANWKMNPLTFLEAFRLATEIINEFDAFTTKTRVVICPPSPFLNVFDQAWNRETPKPFAIGAQDCSEFISGAHTGDVSASQLEDFCQYIIVGHSERRVNHNETDQIINQKIKNVLSLNLTPIFCFGEPIAFRDVSTGALTSFGISFIRKQLDEGLNSILKIDQSKIIFAYEPIWAIGTGTVATTEQIEEVYNLVRLHLFEISPIILYGGSVTINNINNLIKTSSNGFLVGGASLNVDDFMRIVRITHETIA